MLRSILLPTILALLSYAFWVSPSFQEIAAGVAIFLFGMLYLEEGFKAFTGGMLEGVLTRSTDSLPKSVLFGIVTTSVMQSSSLVSVITISFLSAGLIELAAGIGILYGANLGTTTGAWLIAGFGLKVKISAYAMPMLVFGVILNFQRARHLRAAGSILGGLGFLFLGIHHMKSGFEEFRALLDLTAYAMEGTLGVLVYALVGAAATVVMQSSHATLVLIITALSTGQVTYENALGLAIGANVGTTITAILGSISASTGGRRLAAAHLLFNVVTGVVAILAIGPLGRFVGVTGDALGLAADDYTMRLAVFHTAFNTLGVVLFLPFTAALARALERLLPERRADKARAIYLADAAFELPDTTLEAVRKECVRLYEQAFDLIAETLGLAREQVVGDQDLAAVVAASPEVPDLDLDARYEAGIKGLYGEIISFVSRAQNEMTPEQAEELFALRAAGRDLVEAVKDTKHLQKNLRRFHRAGNAAVRAEYAALRIRLARVLRQLEEARADDVDPGAVLSLDDIKVELAEIDSTLNGTLERLIRDRALTPAEATSLMNDASYVYDITKNLVRMGAVIFARGDLAERRIERELALEDEDIEEMALEESNPGAGGAP